VTASTPAVPPGHVSEAPIVTALMQHIIDKHKAGNAVKPSGQRSGDQSKGGVTYSGRRPVDGFSQEHGFTTPSAEAAAAAAAEALASLGITPIKRSVAAGRNTSARPDPGRGSADGVGRTLPGSHDMTQNTVSAMKTAQAAAAQAAAEFALQSAMAPVSDPNKASIRAPPSAASVKDGRDGNQAPPTEPCTLENASGKVCCLWHDLISSLRLPHFKHVESIMKYGLLQFMACSQDGSNTNGQFNHHHPR
jgi:hypothetical protein